MFAGEVPVALPLLREFARRCVEPAADPTGPLAPHLRCLGQLADVIHRLFGCGDQVLRDMDGLAHY